MSSLALRLQARGAYRVDLSLRQGHRYFTPKKTCVALDSPKARRYTNGTWFISKCPGKYGLTRQLGGCRRGMWPGARATSACAWKASSFEKAFQIPI